MSDKFLEVKKHPYVFGRDRDNMPIEFFSPHLTLTQLWLLEKLSDGEHFVIRNFDAGGVLDIEDSDNPVESPIVFNDLEDSRDDVQSTQHWKIEWKLDETSDKKRYSDHLRTLIQY